jgi:hypothetical protein
VNFVILSVKTGIGEDDTRDLEEEGRRRREKRRKKADLHPNHQSYHATPQKLQYAQPNSFYTYHIKLSAHLPPNAI